MQINALIAELSSIANGYGNIKVQLQSSPDTDLCGEIVDYDHFFVVPEPYANKDGKEETICNLRPWPY